MVPKREEERGWCTGGGTIQNYRVKINFPFTRARRSGVVPERKNRTFLSCGQGECRFGFLVFRGVSLLLWPVNPRHLPLQGPLWCTVYVLPHACTYALGRTWMSMSKTSVFLPTRPLSVGMGTINGTGEWKE